MGILGERHCVTACMVCVHLPGGSNMKATYWGKWLLVKVRNGGFSLDCQAESWLTQIYLTFYYFLNNLNSFNLHRQGRIAFEPQFPIFELKNHKLESVIQHFKGHFILPLNQLKCYWHVTVYILIYFLRHYISSKPESIKKDSNVYLFANYT